jgi:cytochrome c-type biogenesis protein CcmH
MRNSLRFAFVLLLLVVQGATAAIEELTFADAEQEARYRQLTDELRCPKCLNANLAGSDAPIAADLRTEIFAQIQQGRSDAEIKEFMTARYGDFILYRPPLNRGTVLLWFGPLALLLAGFFTLRRMLRAARAATGDNTLSADELRQLNSLLKDDKDTNRR